MTEEPICQATLLGRIFHHIIQKSMNIYLETFTDVNDLSEGKIPFSYLIFVDESMRSIQKFS